MPGRIITPGAHGQIAIAIAVDIRGGAHRPAQVVGRVGATGGKGRGGGQPARRTALVEVDPAPVAVVAVGADGEIGQVVAVDVAGRDHGGAEVAAGAFAAGRPGGGRNQTILRTGVEVDRAIVGPAGITGRANHDVV